MSINNQLKLKNRKGRLSFGNNYRDKSILVRFNNKLNRFSILIYTNLALRIRDDNKLSQNNNHRSFNRRTLVSSKKV